MGETRTIPARGEIFAGKYRVDEVLGEGGMGVVVAAHHIHLDERVAIKFLRGDIAGREAAAERFMREARIASKLKNEHIARTLDVGNHDGTLYMIMEYLDGETLAARLRRERALTPTTAIRVVLDVCDGLAVAHAAGIVHRDLKPENVFLSVRADGSRVVKILDFGISKLEGANTLRLTSGGALLGSPLYMSPEQFSDPLQVDRRTDIWALGVILFEAVAGTPPFDAESLPRLCVLVRESPTPSLRTFEASAPPGLDLIIRRCLEKDRESRFSTIHEVAGALREFVSETALDVRGSMPSLPEYRAPAEAPPANSMTALDAEVTAPVRRSMPLMMLFAALAGIGLALAFVAWATKRRDPAPTLTAGGTGLVASVPTNEPAVASLPPLSASPPPPPPSLPLPSASAPVAASAPRPNATPPRPRDVLPAPSATTAKSAPKAASGKTAPVPDDR